MTVEERAFRAVADPTRRQILDLLRESGPQRAGDIATRFEGITRIAVSNHLRVLREADLVEVVESDDARERHYALHADGFRVISAWLDDYEQFWRARLRDLKHLAENPPDGD